MTHYIETHTKDGSPIRIEVEVSSKTGAGFTHQVSPTDVSSDSVRDAYDQTLNTIRGWANGLIDTLQNIDALPSSASVDFAIKIDPEAGAMIAKSRDEGQFRVSLSWKQPDSQKEDEKK
jgi:hypothetical protein